MRQTLESANAGIAELARTLPRPIGLWVGGSAVQQLDLSAHGDRVTILADFNAFERALDGLAPPKR
jgi:hypothetical protein